MTLIKELKMIEGKMGSLREKHGLPFEGQDVKTK